MGFSSAPCSLFSKKKKKLRTGYMLLLHQSTKPCFSLLFLANLCSFDLKDFKIQNIVGSCDVRFPIRLEILVCDHSAFSSVSQNFIQVVFCARMNSLASLIYIYREICSSSFCILLSSILFLVWLHSNCLQHCGRCIAHLHFVNGENFLFLVL